MRSLPEDKFKEARRGDNVFSVTETAKPTKPVKQPPVLVEKFDSLTKLLKVITDFLTRIKSTLDTLYGSQEGVKSEIDKGIKLQKQIEANIERKLQLLNTDDSATEWEFHIHRNNAGRIESIKAIRIE